MYGNGLRKKSCMLLGKLNAWCYVRGSARLRVRVSSIGG